MVKNNKKNNRFSQKELEYYKKTLLELRGKMVAGLKHIEDDFLNKSQKEASGDLSGYSFHMADMATDNFDTEFKLGMASNEQNLLNDIDHALRKIEEGTFGLCEKYNTPITKARLKAMPYARYSLKAQEEEERERRGLAG